MTATEIQPPAAKGRPGAILLAESEDSLRFDIRRNLEMHGHRVVEAASIEEALANQQKDSADILIFDVNVPDGRNWDLINKAQHETYSVMVITEQDDDVAMDAALSMGIKEQLSKPIRPVSLVARVESVLESHRLRDELAAQRRMIAVSDGVDALTGLHNHSRIAEFFAFTAAAAARYGHPVSIVMMDVDFLDRVNNVHGFDAGNRVLCEIADHLAADLRSSDVAGRWDSDQFIVVLPHTDLKGASLFAERLRMTFAEMPVVLPDGTPAAISASFGCAQGTDVPNVMSTVEQKLRTAKQSGRNVVAS